MNAYQDIDDKIISAVRGGKTTFTDILSHVGGEFRVIDRRLQALRKRGLLMYSRKTGWHEFQA